MHCAYFLGFVFPCSVGVVFWWLGYRSKLSALNAARKAAGQPGLDKNDPCIYAMENKSGWRIDGGRWKEICSVVGCLMVIRDIVSNSLKTYV